jgi:3-oxoacyl-[acyl-carrier protein] reductase
MFTNKVIIITGSTQGIGLKTAELLVRRGAYVVINSRSQHKVEATLCYFKELAPHVIGIAGDVSNFEFCLELRKFAIGNFGRIDILINNAGVASSGLIQDVVPNAFEKVVSINLLGSIYPTLACINEIRQQKGSVLFIASVAGIVGLPNYSAYSASKRAIVSLAESLRTELTDDGVFVGVNYPGFTENEDQKTIINAKGEDVLLQKRKGIKALSRERTAEIIIEQLQKRKFRMYSSVSAKAIQLMYRIFPQLTLNILRHYRTKISSMQ